MGSNAPPHDNSNLLSNTESAPHVEPGATMNFESNSDNDNHGLNMDFSAIHISSENEEPMRCVNCDFSVSCTRSYILNTNSERETHIRNVISEWIAPQQIQSSDRICHTCWQQANSVPNPASASATAPTINLPNYTRAPDTEVNCFCPGCESPQHLVVPMWLRVKLFTDFKFYVPKKCRICSFHLQQNNWNELLKTFLEPCHSFTAEYIQDVMSLI